MFGCDATSILAGARTIVTRCLRFIRDTKRSGTRQSLPSVPGDCGGGTTNTTRIPLLADRGYIDLQRFDAAFNTELLECKRTTAPGFRQGPILAVFQCAYWEEVLLLHVGALVETCTKAMLEISH